MTARSLLHPRYRRFVIDLVADVPHGIDWPAPVRALAVGYVDVDGAADISEIHLLEALIAMKLSRFGILVRARGGGIEVTPQ